MRLPRQARERIDRTRPVSFSFEGTPVSGFAGDTIGSALFASGRRVFSRSFKYHRPRGLLCCSGHCPNCMMEVDGVPNVRVCSAPLRERSEEHTSELQSRQYLVCRLLLEKKEEGYSQLCCVGVWRV